MRHDKLSELLDISMGRTPSRNESKYWGEGHKWVSIRDLNSKIITETKEQITDLAIEEARCKVVPRGTLLFSFKLTIGKMAFAGCDLFTNEAIAAFPIKDKRKLNSEYLYYALLSTKFAGSNQAAMGKTLNSKSLADIEIPLPPLDDQIRIAHLLGKVEGLIAQRKENLQQLDELLKSVFLEMFGNPAFNPYHWDDGTFKDAIEYIGDIGSNGSNAVVAKNLQMSDEEDYALMVRTVNLNANDFTDNIKYVSKKTYDFFKKSKVFGGELIMNKIGSAGLFWIMPNLNRPVSLGLNQLLIRIKKEIPIAFIYHFYSTQFGKIKIANSIRGAATKSITKTAVKELPLLFPPKDLQNQFATIVEKVESLKSHYQQSLTELENLYGVLSQKAFKGQLDLAMVPFEEEVHITHKTKIIEASAEAEKFRYAI